MKANIRTAFLTDTNQCALSVCWHPTQISQHQS